MGKEGEERKRLYGFVRSTMPEDRRESPSIQLSAPLTGAENGPQPCTFPDFVLYCYRFFDIIMYFWPMKRPRPVPCTGEAVARVEWAPRQKGV